MKWSQNCREDMDCINTHVNGVYREVWGRRQDDTLDRTLCSTLKLGNVCLGVLLLLLFFMDLGSMLNYTLNSLHPGRAKVTPLQWPTRPRQEKPGFSHRPLPSCSWQGKRNICCWGVTKGETFDEKIAPTWLEQAVQVSSLVTLESCCLLQYILYLRCAAKPRAV